MASFKKIISNPFEDFTDKQMFLIGLIAYVWASLQIYFFKYAPDGVFQAHIVPKVFLYSGFASTAINILVPAAFLFLFGKIIYAKTRFIDVLNTVMIAQIVNYVSAFLLLNPISRSGLDSITDAIESGDMMLKTVDKSDLILVSLMGVLVLTFLVYFFYLLIFGMRVVTNSGNAIHAFIIVILVLIVDILLHFVNPYYFLFS